MWGAVSFETDAINELCMGIYDLGAVRFSCILEWTRRCRCDLNTNVIYVLMLDKYTIINNDKLKTISQLIILCLMKIHVV